LAFGLSAGLDMGTMLTVLETSSGQSAATSDKFRTHVLTGRYASGFSNSLMAKHVGLYLEEAGARGSATSIGRVAAALWEEFAASEPGADFTRIYPFVAAR
jgi:3-hydroxyisobutyrate dehydrogenase